MGNAFLPPANISRNVRSKPCDTSARRSVNGYVALIADETSCSRVKDHYTEELQVAVGISLGSVRKEANREASKDCPYDCVPSTCQLSPNF